MDNKQSDPLFEQSTPGHIDVPVAHTPHPTIESKHPKRVVRWGVLSFFFIQGLGFASWAARIPDIKKTLALSDAGLGSVLFALPAGSVIGLPFAGFLVARFGSKSIVTIAATLYALTLVAIGFASTTWQLVAGLLVFGVCGNLVNIAVNTQAIGVEDLYQKSIMASFHGAWSLAGFTGAAIGGVMVSAGVIPGYHYVAIAVFCLITIAVAQQYLLLTQSADGDHPLFVFPNGPLLRLGVIGFCGMACEGAMFDWSGVYFQNVVIAPATFVTLGYIVFMCAMATGRFTADWLVNHLGRKKMIQLSGLLITLGLSVSIAFPHLVPATVGFLLVGFGVSSVVPLIYSAAGKTPGVSPSMALAAVSTISFFGFLFGPPVIGFIAEAASLRYSYGLIAVLGLCTTVLARRIAISN